jgi:hypothetical protein
MGTVFTIGEKEYDVVKKGIAQARQVADASRWLATYGTPAFKKFAETDTENMGGFQIALLVLQEMNENALVQLFQTVFGCSRQVAEEEFDVSVLIDGLVAMYNNAPAIRKLTDRFFSAPSSDGTEGTSSTPSEAPTAG